MRPIIRVVVALALMGALPIFCIAETPAPALQERVIEFPGDTLKVPLADLVPGYNPANTYDVDILTEQGDSYATRAATLYTTMEPLCHVATLSRTQVIAQTCQALPTKQVAAWRGFLFEVAKLSIGISKEISISTWSAILEQPGSKLYLIDNGTLLIPLSVQSIVNGIRTKTSTFGEPLIVSFSPSCAFPAAATGVKVATLCEKSLPLPPFSVTIEGSSLFLVRLQKNSAKAHVEIRERRTTAMVEAETKALRSRALVILGTVKVLKATPTPTRTPKVTSTPVPTPIPTVPLTPTRIPLPTIPPTQIAPLSPTPIPTGTATYTVAPTRIATRTATPMETPSATPVDTHTPIATPTYTPNATPPVYAHTLACPSGRSCITDGGSSQCFGDTVDVCESFKDLYEAYPLFTSSIDETLGGAHGAVGSNFVAVGDRSASEPFLQLSTSLSGHIKKVCSPKAAPLVSSKIRFVAPEEPTAVSVTTYSSFIHLTPNEICTGLTQGKRVFKLPGIWNNARIISPDTFPRESFAEDNRVSPFRQSSSRPQTNQCARPSQVVPPRQTRPGEERNPQPVTRALESEDSVGEVQRGLSSKPDSPSTLFRDASSPLVGSMQVSLPRCEISGSEWGTFLSVATGSSISGIPSKWDSLRLPERMFEPIIVTSYDPDDIHDFAILSTGNQARDRILQELRSSGSLVYEFPDSADGVSASMTRRGGGQGAGAEPKDLARGGVQRKHVALPNLPAGALLLYKTAEGEQRSVRLDQPVLGGILSESPENDCIPVQSTCPPQGGANGQSSVPVPKYTCDRVKGFLDETVTFPLYGAVDPDADVSLEGLRAYLAKSDYEAWEKIKEHNKLQDECTGYLFAICKQGEIVVDDNQANTRWFVEPREKDIVEAENKRAAEKALAECGRYQSIHYSCMGMCPFCMILDSKGGLFKTEAEAEADSLHTYREASKKCRQQSSSSSEDSRSSQTDNTSSDESLSVDSSSSSPGDGHYSASAIEEASSSSSTSDAGGGDPVPPSAGSEESSSSQSEQSSSDESLSVDSSSSSPGDGHYSASAIEEASSSSSTSDAGGGDPVPPVAPSAIPSTPQRKAEKKVWVPDGTRPARPDGFQPGSEIPVDDLPAVEDPRATGEIHLVVPGSRDALVLKRSKFGEGPTGKQLWWLTRRGSSEKIGFAELQRGSDGKLRLYRLGFFKYSNELDTEKVSDKEIEVFSTDSKYETISIYGTEITNPGDLNTALVQALYMAIERGWSPDEATRTLLDGLKEHVISTLAGTMVGVTNLKDAAVNLGLSIAQLIDLIRNKQIEVPVGTPGSTVGSDGKAYIGMRDAVMSALGDKSAEIFLKALRDAGVDPDKLTDDAYADRPDVRAKLFAAGLIFQKEVVAQLGTKVWKDVTTAISEASKDGYKFSELMANISVFVASTVVGGEITSAIGKGAGFLGEGVGAITSSLVTKVGPAAAARIASAMKLIIKATDVSAKFITETLIVQGASVQDLRAMISLVKSTIAALKREIAKVGSEKVAKEVLEELKHLEDVERALEAVDETKLGHDTATGGHGEKAPDLGPETNDLNSPVTRTKLPNLQIDNLINTLKTRILGSNPAEIEAFLDSLRSLHLDSHQAGMIEEFLKNPEAKIHIVNDFKDESRLILHSEDPTRTGVVINLHETEFKYTGRTPAETYLHEIIHSYYRSPEGRLTRHGARCANERLLRMQPVTIHLLYDELITDLSVYGDLIWGWSRTRQAYRPKWTELFDELKQTFGLDLTHLLNTPSPKPEDISKLQELLAYIIDHGDDTLDATQVYRIGSDGKLDQTIRKYLERGDEAKLPDEPHVNNGEGRSPGSELSPESPAKNGNISPDDTKRFHDGIIEKLDFPPGFSEEAKEAFTTELLKGLQERERFSENVLNDFFSDPDVRIKVDDQTPRSHWDSDSKAIVIGMKDSVPGYSRYMAFNDQVWSRYFKDREARSPSNPLEHIPEWFRTRFPDTSPTIEVGGHSYSLPKNGEELKIGDIRITKLLTLDVTYVVEGPEKKITGVITGSDTTKLLINGKETEVTIKFPVVVYQGGIPRFEIDHFREPEFKKWEDSQDIPSEDQEELFKMGMEHLISASGVEVGKGGLRNLVGIAVSGKVLAVDRGYGHWGYWGPLSKGNAEYMAGNHGPYYVLRNDHDDSFHFLLPTDTARTEFFKGLNELTEKGFLSSDEVSNIGLRTYTYREYVTKSRNSNPITDRQR